MKPRILLINPPIYDFSAYDFWLKPYGLLRVAGFLRGQAEFSLFDAGANPACMHAYLIVGHPNGDLQSLENSMYFAHNLGIRLMLSEFSPIPGTPDGEICRGRLDLDEPLWHNKSAFVIQKLGLDEIGRLKNCRRVESAPWDGQNGGEQRSGKRNPANGSLTG